MPIRTFKFGPLQPDNGPYFNLSDQQTINLIDCRGVIKVNGGYAVQPYWAEDIVDYTVSDFRQGLYSYSRLVSGAYENQFLIANNTTIRQISSGGASDDNVSRGAGYTNTAPQFQWQFTVYGGRVLATNGIDAIQSKLLAASSSFAKNNTISGPVTADPRASFVETFKDHVFIGDFDLTSGTSGAETYGGAYGALSAQRYENAVWWSATDNAARFSDPATTPSIIGSDYRIFNDGLGGVIGLKAATDYLLVSRVGGVSIITGPPFMRFDIETTVGGLFPNSLVRVNNDIYAMSRVGPVVIKDGKEVIRLGTNKINRWLMQVKNILENDSSENHRRQIYGARNITGDYIYWCIKEFDDTGGADYIHMLTYSVDEGEFTIMDSQQVLTSTFTVNEVSLLTSYRVPLYDIYDYGDGVAGFGSITTGIGTFNSLVSLKREVSSSGFSATGFLRASYISIGDATGVYQIWKPKRIRPIFSVDRYDSTLHSLPTGWDSKFSHVVGSIDVFSRARYSGVDTDYSLGSETADSSTYTSLTSLTKDGWFNAESIPAASFHSFKFNIQHYNSLAVFQLIGFDMEYQLEGLTSAGKELVY